MHLKCDNVLEASLLEATDNQPGVSPTLAEEATLLGEDCTPQEPQETTTCPPDCLEEAPKPNVAAGVAGPLNF